MYNCYIRFVKTFPFGYLYKLYHVAIAAITFQYAVAQLVEALRYKPEGRGFDS